MLCPVDDDARYVHLLAMNSDIEIPQCLVGKYSFPNVLDSACSAVLTEGES